MHWPDPAEAIPKITPRGVKVFLRRSTWFNHICANHPELRSCLEDVLGCIERPEGVYQSGPHRFSFRYCHKMGSFIMLVYKVSRNLGWVKTAYTVQNPYVEVEGCNRVWPI